MVQEWCPFRLVLDEFHVAGRIRCGFSGFGGPNGVRHWHCSKGLYELRCAYCPTVGMLSTLCLTLGKMPITPAQCRAARGLIDMDQASLGKAANVSRNTIVSFESEQREPGVNNLAAIQAALESAGVIFVAENGEGPGVRLRKRTETVAGLTREIKAMEADLASAGSAPPQTPAGGMRTLERAHKREAVTKLKNKRTKLKTGK